MVSMVGILFGAARLVMDVRQTVPTPGTQLFFRFVAAAHEHRSLGVASHFGFDQWGHFLPEHTTAAGLLDRLIHHATVVVTEGESFRMREA